MAKVLNIDTLAKEAREIKIQGKTYAMKEMSVSDFVDLTKRAEKIEKTEGDSLSTRIEFLVETIGVSFPGCPAEVLRKRTMDELQAIMEFARDGVIPDEAVIEGDAEKKEVAQS